MNPNDMDCPGMDQELRIGDKVLWTPPHIDERDRVVSKPSPLTIFRVGNSSLSFDYGVESVSGNRFFVRHWEIVLLDGSPIIS